MLPAPRNWNRALPEQANVAQDASPAATPPSPQDLRRCSSMRKHWEVQRDVGAPFCTRCVCLCLEQAEETAGIGWGIVVTRHVSHGTFTEGHAEGGICRQIPECLRQ